MKSLGSLTAAILVALLLFTGCNEPRQPIMTRKQKQELKQHILTSANPAIKVGANFDNKLELMGVDVSSRKIRSGGRLKVTYYWKCLNSVSGDWKIFVHWDLRGRLGDDHYPVRGLFRFNRCRKGQIIRDIRTMTASRRLGNNGISRLYVGVYNPKVHDATGRMPVRNRKAGWTKDHRVLATTITVGSNRPKPKVPIPSYVVRPFEGTIKIDGKPDEDAWKKAAATSRFVHPHGRGASPHVVAKFLYDNEYLYVAFFVPRDLHLWNVVKDKDGQTWNQDVVEVFIDADGDGKTYVELQVTPSNVIFDAFFKTRQKPDWKVARKWDSKMITAVNVSGTVNKKGDRDKGWTVEMKIPIKSLKPFVKNVPPKPGDTWRVNLFVRDHTPADGKIRRRDVFGAWSAPMSGSFHTLERFGFLRFGTKLKVVKKPVKKDVKKDKGKKGIKKSDKKDKGVKKDDKKPVKKDDKKPVKKDDKKK